VQYQETHAGVATDQFGGYIVEVGSGTVVSGNLAGITATADMRIQAETRVGGGAWVLSSVVSLSSAMQNALNNITAFAWGLKGNSGTTAGTNFIGTTDDEDLHIDVRNGGTVEQSLRMNTNQAIWRESTITGITPGNARGKYAVDLQIRRHTATEVASGDHSTIAGGYRNTASGDFSTIGGGWWNTVSGDYSSIAGGLWNTASGENSTIAGGVQNTVSGNYSTIGGGGHNTVSGDYSTIGGGGDNNTVSGERSYIGNGANNEVGGDLSYIGNGEDNEASGLGSYIGNGENNEASGDGGYIGNGANNEAGGYLSYIGNGANNTASGNYATITGGKDTKADKYGQHAFASGSFAAQGDAQTSLFVVRNETTTNASTVLYLDGNSEDMTIPVNTTWAYRIIVVARSGNGAGNSAAWEITGLIDRTFLGTPNVTTVQNTPGWTNPSVILTGNNMQVQVQGASGTTMRWVARVEITEVGL
jgi:hypothetical protein